METNKSWPHLLVSGFGCNPEALNNLTLVYDFLKNLPSRIGMTALGPPVVYRVTPDVHEDTGVTGAIVIATSHVTIHTFPEGQGEDLKKPFFTFDCFSCRAFDSDLVIQELTAAFEPGDLRSEVIYRVN